MGNSASYQQSSQKFSILKKQTWQKQHWLGQSQLVRSLQTNLKGESYHIPIDNFQQQIPIYQFRKDNPSYIVTVYAVQQSSQQILCSGSKSARVITQRIPFRLSDLGNIGYVQGLYVMECILKGAQIIDNRYLSTIKSNQNTTQQIHYTDQMICFTENGQAKIWLTQNLAANHPLIFQKKNNTSENVLEFVNAQKKTVRQLLSIVQSRMSGNKYVNYSKNKKQQQEQLIDYQSCIDFISRMRALEQPIQKQKVKNIILPTMVMRSIKQQQLYQKQNHKNSIQNNKNIGNNNSNNKEGNDKIYNVITNRLNNNNNMIVGNADKMQSSVSSTTSLNNSAIDVNKFAVPPRPRKNSKQKSGSKQKRSNSKSNPTIKPNISPTLDNTNTNHTVQQHHINNQNIIHPQTYPQSQKISLSSYSHHNQNIQYNHINSNIQQRQYNIHPSAFTQQSPLSNVIVMGNNNNNRTHPILQTRQSNQPNTNTNKGRSPFKQMAEQSNSNHHQDNKNVNNIILTHTQQMKHQPKQNSPSTPHFRNQININQTITKQTSPIINISKKQSITTSKPTLSATLPSVNSYNTTNTKNNINNLNINNTNFNISPKTPTFYPIQSTIPQNYPSTSTHTFNNPNTVNKPIITFNNAKSNNNNTINNIANFSQLSNKSNTPQLNKQNSMSNNPHNNNNNNVINNNINDTNSTNNEINTKQQNKTIDTHIYPINLTKSNSNNNFANNKSNQLQTNNTTINKIDNPSNNTTINNSTDHNLNNSDPKININTLHNNSHNNNSKIDIKNVNTYKIPSPVNNIGNLNSPITERIYQKLQDTNAYNKNQNGNTNINQYPSNHNYKQQYVSYNNNNKPTFYNNNNGQSYLPNYMGSINTNTTNNNNSNHNYMNYPVNTTPSIKITYSPHAVPNTYPLQNPLMTYPVIYPQNKNTMLTSPQSKPILTTHITSTTTTPLQQNYRPNKQIQQRVYKVLNRGLLADELISPINNNNNIINTTNNNNINNNSLKSATQTNNNNSIEANNKDINKTLNNIGKDNLLEMSVNTAPMHQSNASNSQIEGSIEQI